MAATAATPSSSHDDGLVAGVDVPDAAGAVRDRRDTADVGRQRNRRLGRDGRGRARAAPPAQPRPHGRETNPD